MLLHFSQRFQEKTNHLKDIFLAGVQATEPYRLIKEQLVRQGTTLNIISNDTSRSIDLSYYKKIFVIGAGKATAAMAKGVEEILLDQISDGIIVVKYGYTEELKKIKVIEAGHPVPDSNSIIAAKMIEALSDRVDEKTLVVTLISGGGSALLAHPFEGIIEGKPINISLKDLQETTNQLLTSGATINEINCIRKHISMIKGGKLAKLLYPATQLNLILSDVVGDRLDSIASGPTYWDETTFKDAFNIIQKYQIDTKLPKNILKIIKAGNNRKIPETPKKDDPIFSKITNIIIGSNYDALMASQNYAQKLGYNTLVLSSQVIGEAREVARVYAGITKDVVRYELCIKRPACIIAGGETTVTIHGTGKGGRNQECALSFLEEIEKDPTVFKDVYFLAASTDGGDGPTDAAGAFASLELLDKAQKKELNIQSYLKNNDSYHFFKAIDGLLITGPTNTNVCDLQIAIIV